jgi:single-stranded-DNA-specific exonuclease
MAVDFAKEAGAEVFLTCDCGTAALAQVEKAKALGMRVVVTDHHEVGELLPNAEAVINPHRPDSKYPFSELSGVGVAFKLCLGLTRELGFAEEKYVRAFSDLAALGTIADVMPLIDENRIIARFGLNYLPQTKKLGLQALMRTIGMEPGTPVKSWDVGFRIGPRLNAAGRVDDARTSLDLLLTNDVAEAQRLAESVEANNKARREAQSKMIDEAQELIEADPRGLPHFIVVGSPTWHPGVVGIVAGRLVERYMRPALVLGIDLETGLCKGSARSVPGFNLANAIHAFPDLMSGGGHAAAAGCGFPYENLTAVSLALDGYARERISDEDLIPRYCADVEVDMEDLSISSIAELAALEPFGRENAEPTFMTRYAVLTNAKLTKDGKHVQMTWQGRSEAKLDGIGFGMGERFEELEQGATYALLFQSKIDEWNGRTKVKLTILDYRRI